MDTVAIMVTPVSEMGVYQVLEDAQVPTGQALANCQDLPDYLIS
jgi:hypothetical protein